MSLEVKSELSSVWWKKGTLGRWCRHKARETGNNADVLRREKGDEDQTSVSSWRDERRFSLSLKKVFRRSPEEDWDRMWSTKKPRGQKPNASICCCGVESRKACFSDYVLRRKGRKKAKHGKRRQQDRQKRCSFFSQNKANRDGWEERGNRGRLSEGAGERQSRLKDSEMEGSWVWSLALRIRETERAGEKCPLMTYAALTVRLWVFLQIQPSVTVSFLESRASRHNRDAAMSMNALLREAPHNYWEGVSQAKSHPRSYDAPI